MPSSLITGSKIIVCAPSSHADPILIDQASDILVQQGYEVAIPDGLYETYGQIAGTELHRAQSCEIALLSDDYDAILFACGGHRSAQIVPLLDWDKIKTAKPKLIMGMSDNSALLNSIANRLNWITILGPTLHQMAKKDNAYSNPALSCLKNGYNDLPLLYDGDAVKGRVIACTLSLLPLIIANEGLDYFKDSILCLEDIGEEYSSIDRLMLHAKLSGIFNKGYVKAIVLGEFTNMRDTGRPFGFTILDIVQEHTNNLPIASDAPFGHGDQCMPIPIGAQGVLEKHKLLFKI